MVESIVEYLEQNPDKILAPKEIIKIRHSKAWTFRWLCNDDERRYINGLLKAYLKILRPITRNQFLALASMLYQEVYKYRAELLIKEHGTSIEAIKMLSEIEGRIVSFKRAMGLMKGIKVKKGPKGPET